MTAPPSAASTAAEITRLLKEVEDARSDAVRLDELRKVFARLIQSGELDLYASSRSPSPSTAMNKWNQFLIQSHKQMIQQLTHRIRKGKRAMIRTFWGVVASSPRVSPKGYQLVSSDLLQQFVRSLSPLTLDKGLRNMLGEFVQYRDVQFYLMGAIASRADILYKSGNTKEHHANMLLELLCMIPIVTTQDELDEGLYLFPLVKDVVPDVKDREEGLSDDDDDSGEDDQEGASEESDDEARKTGRHAPSEPPKKKRRKDLRSMFSFQIVRAHHRVLSKAWLAVLRLSLPLHALKQALLYLPTNVLPNVPKPLLFADFFMSAYACTGVIPILALEGLFLLMTQHRLEYPDFYKQLYRILTPQLLFVKYRTRFFRLLDKCLKNELLPAHIVAAFVKRLCRCTLSAPPSATLFVLALCSNLIRKHPETVCLIHRTDDIGEKDGFNSETNDPEQANALSSSLFELQVLERHYSLPVATLAKSLGRIEELSAPLYNLEDFLGHTYKTMMDQERKRRRKANTPLTFVEPKGLFLEGDVFSGILETR